MTSGNCFWRKTPRDFVPSTLGRARVFGNTTIEQKIRLHGLKEVPKRALLNYNDDVLASD